MTAPVQPGDVRVNRANILRRIGRVCFASGDQPGLPAPDRIEFTPSLALYFDSLAEASEWANRYDLHGRISRVGETRQIVATGVWEGIDIGVMGWSKDGPAPADTDPDDLSDVIARHYDASADHDEWVCACGEEFGALPPLKRHIAEGNAASVEDVAPRGTNAAEHHQAPPADVEGHAHKRGGEWTDEDAHETYAQNELDHDRIPTAEGFAALRHPETCQVHIGGRCNCEAAQRTKADS